MPRSADRATVRIIRAQQSAIGEIRSRVERFVGTAWDGLDDYRDRDIDRFRRQAAPVMMGAERSTAVLTNAYLAGLAAHTLGGRRRPVRLDLAAVTGAALRGVDPADVYRRPGETVWTELSNGKPLDEAVREGRRRALTLAMTDLQLAKTHTARAVFRQDGRVAGHRRVLTGRENCGLCIVASTQRYHSGDLQPIHPGCDCEVEPIYGAEDPGQVIDPETLEQAHAAIEERFGVSDRGARDPVDYRDVLLVEEHGELGPVLTVKGHRFTGPADLGI